MSDALKKSHANCGIYVGSINTYIYLIYTPKARMKNTHTHLSILNICCRWFSFAICIDFQSTYKLWFVRKLSLLTDTQFLLYVWFERSKNQRNEKRRGEQAHTNERTNEQRKKTVVCVAHTKCGCVHSVLCWCWCCSVLGRCGVLWCAIYVEFD